ncbi:phosphoribosylglycinamide formyltransferase [Bacillus paralicheniformis]|uniref:phosphoribosylglycinamide formyltransferase n=1 Tax=Bacillus paralicheniformis TaxID=1648923 RepID=UPI002DB70A00|nr:phosphoribosylglycinamide formyltransferase [Bacillus paralicheniformis]MEC1023237.1 phosphoribosylglycinamide formyltransferase [Bacillus paralicheniformis]MEC1026192.1 phosphoribosylglycinamide formyltransferase [Bacillus paralicheniformis]MEC1035780.1 phosphoribosylglycinamide formyltransferase [Bacillus paralicheniformis]MEC1050082.1 phosphoribosylglycinamide formyltransferase [Bacillus paralicheniformis]MEC1060339.1 phosphoribosylglycinamide formyltransferase [Bacillus paralicheniformi
MRKFAVFASGSGTNFEAIARRMREENWDAEIVLVVSDKPDAKVLERAEKAGIPSFPFQPKSFENKAAFEQVIVEQLRLHGAEWIVLAGYMRLIGDTLLSAYRNKIINIHPSLLPAFPGIDAIGQAYRAGVKVAGITVHYVDEGMDTGPIIAQRAVELEKSETLASLEEKIHKLEHELYPEVIKELLELNGRGEKK